MIFEYGNQSFNLVFNKIAIWNFNNDENKKLVNLKMQEYFYNKKLINGTFYEDDLEIIDKKEYFFIDVEDICLKVKYNNIFDKEVLSYFEEIIKLNIEKFNSIEKINEILIDSITDIGINKMLNTFNNGLDIEFNLKIKYFDAKVYAKLLYLEYDYLSEIHKTIIIMNMQLFKQKNQKIIIYFNKYNDEYLKWINNNLDKSNIYFVFINDEIVDLNLFNTKEICLVDINNKHSQIYNFDENIEQLNLFCYSFNKKTIKSKKYQTQKVQNIINSREYEVDKR